MAEGADRGNAGGAAGAIIVAIYCRLSKFGGMGIDRQEADCRRIAAARGWIVGEVFRETASASPHSKKARKEWVRLLAAIERGEFNAVIVWLEDRSNRNVVEAAEFVKVCQQAGMNRVIISGSDTEYDFRDPEDVAKFYGESVRAQAEIARMQKRIRRAKKATAEAGEDGGGPRPFGFKSDRMSIEESEAALIREAARRVLAGDSLRGICVEWNNQGFRTTRGARWVNSSLRRMLIRPRTAGLRGHHGECVPAVWPAILDRETWEAVRAILTDPARNSKKGAPTKYLLTGLLRCGVCNDRLSTQRAVNNGREYMHYKCLNRYGDGAHITRNMRDVDDEVSERMLYRLESTAFEQAASRPADDPTRELYEQLAREQGVYDRLEDKLARELISEATFKRHRAESEQRMDGLRQKIAELTGNRIISQLPRNLWEVWPSLSLDRKRAILAAVIDHVVVHTQGKGQRFDPTKIQVLWKA